MHARKAILLPVLLAVTLAAGLAGAGGTGRGTHALEKSGATARRLGFELKETKEELKLQYDVKVQDNGGGRMSVVLTLADEGRIKPLSGVSLAVPSKDGSGYFDVVVSLAPYEQDGKKIYNIQLTRELAERGEIDLKTSTMDGKRMLDWGYHAIRLASHVKAADQKAKEKQGDVGTGAAPSQTAPTASERKP